MKKSSGIYLETATDFILKYPEIPFAEVINMGRNQSLEVLAVGGLLVPHVPCLPELHVSRPCIHSVTAPFLCSICTSMTQ